MNKILKEDEISRKAFCLRLSLDVDEVITHLSNVKTKTRSEIVEEVVTYYIRHNRKARLSFKDAQDGKK